MNAACRSATPVFDWVWPSFHRGEWHWVARQSAQRSRLAPKKESRIIDFYSEVKQSLESVRKDLKIALARSKRPELEMKAQELFDALVSVERETDPEDLDDETLVFAVTAHGDVKGIVQKEIQWNGMVRDILGDASDVVRLVIDVS